MKLKLMQSGGFIPPYTIYLPVLTTYGTSRRTRTDVDDFLSSTSSSRGSKSESSDTKGLITDKDLLSLVDKLDVLPSDKKEIISSLYHFYQIGSIPGMIDSSSLALKYLETVNNISQATYNKKEFDKMMDTAISKDVLNDAALTINNHVLVFDKETGELTPMSIENYREHIDEYSRPMTNGEILLRRALFDSDDPSYLNTIQNATSLELVNKTIYDMITGFGYSQLANSTYEQRKNSLIIQGIEELLQAAENGDLTITNSTYAISDSERKKYNRPLIDRALDYILHALPPNQKALLLLYSEDGTKESMEALITHLVTSKEIYDVSTTTKDSLGDGKSVKSGSGKGSGSKDEKSAEYYSDLFLQIITGNGGSYGTFTIEDKDGYTMSVSGVQYPNLSVKSTNQVPKECSLGELLSQYGLSGIRTESNAAITFGELPLNLATDANDIVFANNFNATRVILPTKIGANNQIVPDLEFATAHKDIIDQINKELNTTNRLSDDTMKKIQELNFINSFTGEVDLDKLQPYLLIDGLGTNLNIDIKNNQFVTETKDKRLIQTFKDGVYHKADSEHESNYKFDFDEDSYWPWDWAGQYTHLYKGVICIPITQNILQGATAAGTNIKQYDINDIEGMYLRGTLRKSFNDTTSEKLGDI